MPRFIVGLTLTLLALLLSFHGVAAQKAEPEVDVFGLYRLVGRSWTIKSVHWERGKPATCEYRRYFVTAIQGDICTVKSETVDRDGFSQGVDQARDLKLDGELKATLVPAEGARPVRLHTAGGAFSCMLTEQVDPDFHYSIWRSSKYPALVVKEQTIRADAVELRELVGFDEGVPDPWALYRMVGRRWTYSLKEGPKGEAVKTTFIVHEVTHNSPTGATVRVSRLDESKKPIAGDAGEELKIDFEADAGWSRPEATKDCEVADGNYDAANIKWASVTISNKAMTCHMSRNWPGLLLGEKTESSEKTLVEFCTGHDFSRLYRKQGNFALSKTLVRMNMGGRGGMNTVSYMRQDVVAATETQATLRTSGYDQNMKKTFSNENSMGVSKFSQIGHSGDEPIEELIMVCGGAFACLKTVTKTNDQNMNMWMHHGIMLRMTNEAKGFSMITEVTELKLE